MSEEQYLRIVRELGQIPNKISRVLEQEKRIADFSKTFTLQALYRQVLRSGASEAHPSFQLTTVWGVEFAKGWCTFSGYADLWYGYTPRAEKGLVFMSEPQLWVNVLGRGRQDDRLSFGTEWEVSYDFVWPAQGSRRIFLNPTVAVKYTF